MNINEKLKEARVAANLTQEAVAENIGVTRQTISNWEKGKSYPDIARVIMLSDLYEVTLDELLKGDQKMIKHLKESTDITKSNKQLTISILFAGIFTLTLILIRIFMPVPPISGFLANIIAVAIFFIGLIVALASSINIRQLAQNKTSNKTLIKIVVVILYVLIYIPLLLVIPQAISSTFQIEAAWQSTLIRSCTALILLVPATFIYKKLQNIFSGK